MSEGSLKILLRISSCLIESPETETRTAYAETAIQQPLGSLSKAEVKLSKDEVKLSKAE